MGNNFDFLLYLTQLEKAANCDWLHQHATIHLSANRNAPWQLLTEQLKNNPAAIYTGVESNAKMRRACPLPFSRGEVTG